jgi:hypothetical protein
LASAYVLVAAVVFLIVIEPVKVPPDKGSLVLSLAEPFARALPCAADKESVVLSEVKLF